jgi:hypothetical protein
MKLVIALLGLLACSNALVINTRPAVSMRRATSSCTPVSVPQRAGEPEMFIFWCAPPRCAHAAIFHAVHAHVSQFARSLHAAQHHNAPPALLRRTMKTAFDSFMYAIGQTDMVKGTGVWSFLEINREDEAGEQMDGKVVPTASAAKPREPADMMK